MAVLIKDMEMPMSCWRCPFCLTVDPDTYRCIPTGHEFESTFDAINHIVCDCPLVPVPPHGRLIDADALIEANAELADCDFIHPRIESTLREVIEDAPTIIEAEGD